VALGEGVAVLGLWRGLPGAYYERYRAVRPWPTQRSNIGFRPLQRPTSKI